MTQRNREDLLSVSSVFDTATNQDDFVTRKVAELLEHESFRKRILEVVSEHTDSVPFMEKVQNYADRQIDARLFKNTKVMGALFLGWIATAVITFVVTKWSS